MKIAPYDRANILSKLFYSWMNPIFTSSRKSPLTSDDIYPKPLDEDAQKNTENLEREWNKERNKRNPKLFFVILRCFLVPLIYSALAVVTETVAISSRPIVMQRVLLGFQNMNIPKDRDKAIIYGSILVILSCIGILSRNVFYWVNYRLGLRLRVAVSGLVFKKMLRLNQKALSLSGTGQIINLLSTDGQKFELTFEFLHYIWLGPIQLALVLWMMMKITMIPSLCAIAVLFCFIPVQTVLNRIYANLREETSRITDKRILLLSDIICGIRMIKFHAWEEVFTKFVQKIRSRETKVIMYSRICQAFQFTQLVFQVRLATVALLLAILLPHQGTDDPIALRSFYIYTLLNFVDSLFLSVTLFMPMALQNLYDTLISCKRITAFLTIPELVLEHGPYILDSHEPQVRFLEVNAQWCREHSDNTLTDVSFDVRGPQLVGIVGGVGSGKSSLLMATLGELPVSSGFVFRSRDVAYAPQIPWIFSGTIRENVLCGLEYDDKRYNEILESTTLSIDIAGFPLGDQTQVGDRGLSLSGGQKARIGLARVAYSQAQFVLLDDPLAAVDARVTNHLFEKCIAGYLSNRLRLLVTHQHHLLAKMDKIIVMNEGRVQFYGTYNELQASGINIYRIIASEFTECLESDIKTEQIKSDNNGADNLAFEPLTEDEIGCSEVFISTKKLSVSHDKSTSLRQSIRSGEFDVRRKSVFDNISSSRALTPRHSIASIGALSMEGHSVETDGYSIMNDEDENGRLDGFSEPNDQMEKWSRGAVAWRNYVIFGRLGGGITGIIITLALFTLTTVNIGACDMWIAQWSSIVDKRNQTTQNENSSSNFNADQVIDFSNNYVNLYIYCGLTGFLILISSVRSLTLFGLLLNSAKVLHDRMLRACLATRIRFFEINPSGRILNRFSRDIGQIDALLPLTIHDALQCLFLVIGLMVVSFISSYWLILPVLPLLVVFYYIRKYYVFTSRDLKRIEAVARSPVYNWVNITVQGLPCIRATCTEMYQWQKFNELTDIHTGANYLNIAAGRWLAIRLDMLCWLFILSVMVICILLGIFAEISGAHVGLLVTYSNSLIGLFQWCVRQSTEVENQMVSVERAVEYMDIPPEVTEPPEMEPPSSSWPSKGRITFRNYWLRYLPGGSWALREINLDIKPGTKVGIVGRTGAGKSSLISAIFRLVENEKGNLQIDDVDIGHLKLHELRKRISIIPQDPIMFVGTIRTNLDPGGQKSDAAIWKALTAVQLQRTIQNLPKGLDTMITEGGSNFSTGQRQLLSLARAILGENLIIVVDEATANVDPATDAIIQKTLRTQFSHCTVLTVAHRLHTVIDNDLIVVMETGRIVEVGPPHLLLNPEMAENDAHLTSLPEPSSKPDFIQNPITGTGPLANLVRHTGLEESHLLAQIARKAYIEMNKRRVNSNPKLMP